MSGALLITNLRNLEKGSLLGFFDVELPSGMILRDCALLAKNGRRWIDLPSQKVTGKDGKTTYKRLVEFSTRELADKFRDEVLLAIDAQHQAPPTEISDADIPF